MFIQSYFQPLCLQVDRLTNVFRTTRQRDNTGAYDLHDVTRLAEVHAIQCSLRLANSSH